MPKGWRRKPTPPVPDWWPDDERWPPKVADIVVKKRRRWPKVVIPVLALLLCVGGWAWWEVSSTLDDFHAGYKKPIVDAAEPELNREPQQPAPVKQPGLEKATTFLIIGSDIRPTMDEQWGRSDTIILARVMPDKKIVSLLSLPRDLYVNIPGYGMNKINAAYSFGGPELLIATVREYLGVKIDHFFQIDFTGFGQLVGEVGGVYLPVDQRYYHSNEGLDPSLQYSEIDLRPGYQFLGAEDALAFARYRHGDTDFLRAARQQLFLREVGRQVQQLRSDPIEVRDFVKAVAKASISDLDSVGESLQLANTLRQIPSDHIVRTVLHAGSTYGNGVYLLQASEQELKEALSRWADPESVTGTQQRRPKPGDLERGIAGLAGAFGEYLGRIQPMLRRGGRELESMVAEQLKRGLARHVSDKEAAEKEAASGLIGDGGIGAGLVGDVDGLHTCNPTKLPPGYQWPAAEDARHEYELDGNKTLALYASRASGYSVLWTWTRWQDPPILAQPTDAIELGGRDYQLFWESGALRIVSWSLGRTRAWITNTLSNDLTPEQMLELARSCV